MVIYKEGFFFLVPDGLSSGHIRFDVYDINGRHLGDNFTGVKKCKNYSKEEIFELEELIQDQSINFETRIKFAKEFGVKIEKWKEVKKEKEKILLQMHDFWNVPKDIINNYLV
jgi:hypothetical protein